MDFLKKHYEKILLGVMLVGLIGVLVFMLFYIASEKSAMAEKSSNLTNPRVRELTNLDMTILDASADRLKGDYSLDLETTNKLFNPMEWQRALDGSLLLKLKKTGLQVAQVTNIVPLYTVISLDSIITNELGVKYVILVERQAEAIRRKRRPESHYILSTDRTAHDAFAIEDVKGPPENPTGLVIKLTDTGEIVTITKETPYRRTDGYMADFRYAPENRAFHDVRVGDRMSFAGSDYVVVDINANELILQDQSNQKKTSLPFVP